MNSQKIERLKKVKNLNRLLPLVAIGTVADCQSILDPINRLLVKAGLKILNDNSHNLKGLQSMVDYLGFQSKMVSGYQITSQDLGFVFSPVLNSSGRLTHAKLSIETLLGDTAAGNIELIKELSQTNDDRKAMVRSILSEVESEAKSQYEAGEQVIWLEGDWSKGIVGLLASRLVNKFNLPVVVISIENESVSASLRAPEGYHLPNVLNEIKPLLLKGGGHPGAAGFSALASNKQAIQIEFKKSILSQISSQKEIKPVYLPSNFEIDPGHVTKTFPLNFLQHKKNLLWLEAGEIDQVLLKEIFELDPFGQDFAMPGIITRLNIQDFNFKWLGQEQKHIKIDFIDDLKITAFNLGSEVKDLLTDFKDLDIPIWLELKLSQNSWNGNTKLELIAENIWV